MKNIIQLPVKIADAPRNAMLFTGFISFGMDTWKDVNGYEGRYKISSTGMIKSFCRNKNGVLLKQNDDGRGYLSVCLYKSGVGKTKRVHVLVAISFLNHNPCGHDIEVDHIDGNKRNNNVENLQLITARENTSRFYKNTTSKYTGVYWHKPNNKWRAKIRVKGKEKCLGYFDDEKIAAMAYKKMLQTI